MKKQKEKPSGFELLMSFVVTLVCIAIVFFLGACVIGYYTNSITNALIVFVTGLVIASGISSFRFWRAERW